MKIRPAKLSDLAEILRIERENFSAEEAISEEVFRAHLAVIQTSFLVAESEEGLLGYIEGPVTPYRHLKDQSFTAQLEDRSHRAGGYISVTSLSVAKKAQALGVGSYLLQALKDLAQRDKREGINLTCHDYLIGYYEKQGFTNEGLSQSTYAGEVWYDMVWQIERD